jgi:hypothetical protein
MSHLSQRSEPARVLSRRSGERRKPDGGGHHEEPTSERLKIQVGSAVSDHQEVGLPIKGRCIKKGVPREATVRGCEVREALCMPLEQILNTIREVLEQAPPELSADLLEGRTGPALLCPGSRSSGESSPACRMATIRKRTLNGRTHSKLLKPSARLTTSTAANTKKSTPRSI